MWLKCGALGCRHEPSHLQLALFSVRQMETSVDSATPKRLPRDQPQTEASLWGVRGAHGGLAWRHLQVTQGGLRYLGGSLEVEDRACSMRLQSWGEQNVAPGPYPAAAAFTNKVLLARRPPAPTCIICGFSYYLQLVETSCCLGSLKTKMLTIWSFMGLWDGRCKRNSGFQANPRKNSVRSRAEPLALKGH